MSEARFGDLGRQQSRGRRFRSFRRDKLRPVWQDLRPLVIVAGTLLVIALATYGFAGYQEYSWDDALYRSFHLFAFGGAAQGLPLEVRIARILGLMVVGYAAVRGLAALSRQQAQIFISRVVLRNHVVIAGLGVAGLELATAFHRAGYRVVVIERDPANPGMQGCRSEGIGVLQGDATSESMLRKVGVGRAERLIVVCGEDITNMNVSLAAREVTAKRRIGTLVVHLELDDFDLWQEMEAHSLINSEQWGCRVEPFNMFVTGAQMLLREHPPFPSGVTSSKCLHIVIIGLDAVGPHLLLNIGRLWQDRDKRPGETLRITIAGDSVDRQYRRLVGQHPNIEQLKDCEIHTVAVEPGSRDLRRSELLDDATAVYVSLSSETASVAVGLMLSGRFDLAELPAVVALASEKRSVADVLERRPGPVSIKPFGVLTRSLSPDALIHGTNELLAHATHEIHLRSQLAKRVVKDEDPSLVPWHNLKTSLKQSNRRSAERIAEHLADLHCVAVPAPLIDPRHPPFTFSEGEVIGMAPREHERWERDQRRDGWRWTADEKNPDSYRHPMIGVSFEELPEANKETDRDHIRAIPEILALAGFDVVRVDRDREQRHQAQAASRSLDNLSVAAK